MEEITQTIKEVSIARKIQSGYLTRSELHLNKREYLCRQIRLRYPEIEFPAIWEASGRITLGQYRHLLALCFEKSKQLRAKIKIILDV